MRGGVASTPWEEYIYTTRDGTGHEAFRADEPAVFDLPGPHLCGAPRADGTGRWFVLDPEGGWVWAVTNNGMDGDDWSRNNIRTAGAGATGRRIPWTQELATEIQTLHDHGTTL